MLVVVFAQGVVFIVSPRRGSSVENFVEKAQKWFDCECIENYDEFVWSAYCKVSICFG